MKGRILLQDRKENISASTKEKVERAKLYIERRYFKLIQQEKEKKENWEMIQRKMLELNLSQKEIQLIKANIMHKQAVSQRLNRRKIEISHFQCIRIIGKGAFGEVRLCRDRESGQPVAIKALRKSQMIQKKKVAQVWEERQAMASASNNKWIVKLKCSFQDDKNLYLVMQYLPGGDLMNLLIKKDIFTEDEARFYIAEIILALEEFHKMKFIHRDLKPDNILLDVDGHIKLSDFGLCKYFQQRNKKLIDRKEQVKKNIDALFIKDFKDKRRKMAYSAVGTPDYVAPQVQINCGYTQIVDWWSVGVILYQMLVGHPPFMSDDYSITWDKILNWRKTLLIPKEANLTTNAIDLIRRLINDAKERLGSGGIDQIKNHPFFSDVDWKKLRESKAPNVPILKDEFDCNYFDQFDQMLPWQSKQYQKKYRKDPNFIGYTFKNIQKDYESDLLRALLDLRSKYTPTQNSYKNSIEALQLQVNFSKKTNQIFPPQMLNIKSDKYMLKLQQPFKNIFPQRKQKRK